MESALDWHSARALLDWHLELGVDETICEAPVDRFAAEAALRQAALDRAQATRSPAASAGPGAPDAPAAPIIDPVAEARAAAGAAASLDALRDAMAAFTHCELRRGARNLVFSDGVPGADLMIVGEAPGRDEDLQGKPFVGRAGQLLDRMLAAIGRDRSRDVYITNVMPWRPPQNRDPKPDEIAMMMPFLERHIALAAPKVLMIVGNTSCQALLGRRGITRLRGTWTQAQSRPAMPMVHPAYLLRNPGAKRDAWADLLEIRARLEALA